jgi:ribosome-binding ATPase
MLRLGIVGLPNVGKSTLFNALTRTRKAEAANYPFCTIDPNVGVVPVPDARLARIEKHIKTQKVIPAIVEIVDIAGLVKGASQGEGLGNKFLANIRETHAILMMVRCFDDPDVVHVAGKVDPRGDKEVVETELMLKDLESVEKRRERSQKNAKAPGKPGELAKAELAALDKVKAALEEGVPVRAQQLTDDERALVSDLFLLTSKPVIYVANVDEGQLAKADGDPRVQAVKELAKSEGFEAVVLCGKVEAEIAELAEAERNEFLQSLGLAEPGLERLVHAGYRELGLITFLTAGEDECRAWTVKRGARAPQAAGVIHTDFERGFIKAEVMRTDDLLRLGSEAAVKEKGLMRVEGKEYVVQDGDVMHFRFNV